MDDEDLKTYEVSCWIVAPAAVEAVVTPLVEREGVLQVHEVAVEGKILIKFQIRAHHLLESSLKPMFEAYLEEDGALQVLQISWREIRLDHTQDLPIIRTRDLRARDA